MTRTLSPRAQEILAALEREAAARRSDAQLGMRSPAAPPLTAGLMPDRGPAPDLPALVAATLAQTELRRQRLSALADAVEEFASRVSAVGAPAAATPEIRVSPAALPAQAGECRISNRAARRLAADLAATGASRDAVGEELRSLYAIADPTPTLDLVFGAAAPDEKRRGSRTATPPDPTPPEIDETPQLEPSRTPEPAAAKHEPRAGASAAPALEQSPALEVIDLHHHLLPGIDDGPPTLDDALALARAAVAAGTTTVVATPHVSWGYPANTAARIAEQVIALEVALAEASIPLRVLPGAEVAMTHAVDLSDEELRALHLGGGPYLLVECPLTPTGTGFELVLGSLLDRGHRILLAHPERCRAFQRDHELLTRLVSRGALAQITASSLSGGFGRTVREVAHGLVRDGLAHVVASDAHSVDRRPPSLLDEVRQEGYAEQATWLVGQVPRAILDGSRVPLMPVASPRPRQGLKRLLGR